MRLSNFLDTIEETAGITPEEAERAARATLKTLSERITRGESEDIAAFLPKELRAELTSAPEPAEPFGLEDFVQRVAAREGVDEATAYGHVQAVFVALGQAVAPGELGDMAAQLSSDFEPLLKSAQIGRGRGMPPDPLVHRVAELLEVDPPTARRAVETVLETLVVRISQGEAEDLMERLPPDLMPAIERGLAESKQATRMSLGEFLEHVARREGVDADEAARHARAVFAALRELVPNKEIYDVESELPREYAPLFSGFV
jgi:uncharacterized protein (DUF2267 family)